MIVLYLLFVVVVSATGGTVPALVAAVAGFLAVNWYFTPPIHEWTIAEGENVVALIVYLLTAVIVSALVAVATRRTAEAAAHASAEAETLSAPASGVVEADPLPILISHLRRASGSLVSPSCAERTTAGSSKPPTGPESTRPRTRTRSTTSEPSSSSRC